MTPPDSSREPCLVIGPLLSASLDDELDETQWERLELHLASCAECRARLRQEEACVLRLEGLGTEPATQDLWPSLEPALPPSPASSDAVEDNAESSGLGTIGLGAFVALAVLLGGGKLVGLAALPGAGWGLRLGLLAVVAVGFLIARVNPFSAPGENEIEAAARAAMSDAAP